MRRINCQAKAKVKMLPNKLPLKNEVRPFQVWSAECEMRRQINDGNDGNSL